MCHAVGPVEADVDQEETEQPGVQRVPWQSGEPEVVVHQTVAQHLDAADVDSVE